MSQQYQVVGSVAIVTQDSPTGPVKLYRYQGGLIGPGAKPEEIEHNLAVGLIAPVNVPDAPAQVDESGEGDDEPEPTGDIDAQRAAAVAKLPAEGSPDGRAAKQVWVEYGVKKGYDRASLEAEDKPTLVALLKEG